MSSAAVSYAVAHACGLGKIPGCECLAGRHREAASEYVHQVWEHSNCLWMLLHRVVLQSYRCLGLVFLNLSYAHTIWRSHGIFVPFFTMTEGSRWICNIPEFDINVFITCLLNARITNGGVTTSVITSQEIRFSSDWTWLESMPKNDLTWLGLGVWEIWNDSRLGVKYMKSFWFFAKSFWRSWRFKICIFQPTPF